MGREWVRLAKTQRFVLSLSSEFASSSSLCISLCDRLMGSWEEIAIGWTSLGVLKLMKTAASVPAWEYFSLVSLLTLAWLYCILDFHFMSALRGDAIRLFYNHESKIQCQILQHCRVLKERCISQLKQRQLNLSKQMNFCILPDCFLYSYHVAHAEIRVHGCMAGWTSIFHTWFDMLCLMFFWCHSMSSLCRSDWGYLPFF